MVKRKTKRGGRGVEKEEVWQVEVTRGRKGGRREADRGGEKKKRL